MRRSIVIEGDTYVNRDLFIDELSRVLKQEKRHALTDDAEDYEDNPVELAFDECIRLVEGIGDYFE